MKINVVLIYFIVLLIGSSCNQSKINVNDTIEVLNNFSELQSIIDSNSDKVMVVNFWATSCPPCLKEMPHFVDLQKSYDKNEVKFLLVSLDKVRDLDKRVLPFVKKHNITPEVAILGDDNYSAWTDKIDPSWYGALPATIIIRGDEKKFKFGMYESMQELKTDIELLK
ncbi:MAG: redoxin domain-containing protein [Saprospiraceae bacterium]